MGKSSRSILSVVTDLILSYATYVVDLAHLAALEAELAVKTFLVLAVLIFLLGSIITVSWLSILVWIFFYLVALHFSLLKAWSIIVGINLVVFIALGITIYRLKDRLFFPETRAQLHSKRTLVKR